jgi:hypothetical protein
LAGVRWRTAKSDALVVAAVLAGLALRGWVLASPLGALDADEAIVGLMARCTAARRRRSSSPPSSPSPVRACSR